MAEADLDIVIRQLAKQQNKGLMTAVKRRRDRYVSLAAKAKDKDTKEKYRQIAKNIMLHRRRQAAADFRRQRRGQLREIDAKRGRGPARQEGGQEDKSLIQPSALPGYAFGAPGIASYLPSLRHEAESCSSIAPAWRRSAVSKPSANFS